MSTTARQIARAYDSYISAVWRGDTSETRRFAAWLKGCWGLGGPPEPAAPPAAISALGGAGASIRWHETPSMILGYIPGVLHRCYQVPRDAVIPGSASDAEPVQHATHPSGPAPALGSSRSLGRPAARGRRRVAS